MTNTNNTNNTHWTSIVKQIQTKYKLNSFKDAKKKWKELKQKKGGINKKTNNKISAKKYQQLEKFINKFINELTILKNNKNDYDKELIGGSKLANFFIGLTKGLQSLGKIPKIFEGLNKASRFIAKIVK